MITLFSLQNGDDMANTFRGLLIVETAAKRFVTNVYLFTFLLLFVFAVSKITVAIIEA